MSSKIKKNTILVISLSVVCGLAAGVLGGIVTRNYIFNDLSSPYTNQEVNLTNLNNTNSNLVIQDPKKVVINQDQEVAQTINSLSTSMVSVFKEINSKTDTDSTKPNYYSLDNPLFLGLIMTSDGWAMSSLPDDMKKDFSAKGFVAITADRKVYKIDEISVLKNLPGDIIFFHLASASNLSVRKTAPRSELALGQSLLVIDNQNNVWPTTLASFKKTPDVLNSDSLNARLELANNSDALQKNSLIFNLSGDLVAIINANKEVTPAFAYDSYWQSLWKTGETIRPFLGVNYLDLASAKIPSKNLDKGALIYPNDKVAVVKGSPAAAAGFIAGDIITWIDNNELDKNDDLADIITTYKSGDKITISYLRDNQEKQIDVTLGKLK
jgi:hypothetical protein